MGWPLYDNHVDSNLGFDPNSGGGEPEAWTLFYAFSVLAPSLFCCSRGWWGCRSYLYHLHPTLSVLFDSTSTDTFGFSGVNLIPACQSIWQRMRQKAFSTSRSHDSLPLSLMPYVVQPNTHRPTIHHHAYKLLCFAFSPSWVMRIYFFLPHLCLLSALCQPFWRPGLPHVTILIRKCGCCLVSFSCSLTSIDWICTTKLVLHQQIYDETSAKKLEWYSDLS